MRSIRLKASVQIFQNDAEQHEIAYQRNNQYSVAQK
jgi:hypothetical protein